MKEQGNMLEARVPPQPGKATQAPQLLPMGRIIAYVIAAIIFCALATIGFGWLAKGVLGDRFVAFDDGVLTFFHGYWSPGLNQLMLVFTMLGDPAVLIPLLLFVGIALWARGRWIDAAGLLLAGGGAGLLNQLLKEIFQRVRPSLFDGPFHLTSYSFPSGHSMGSMACYGMLAYIAIKLLEHPVSRVAVGIAAALLILCIGISRIYFNVHYPTDVLGGFIAGAIWLVFSIVVVQAAEWHASRRAHTVAPSA